MVCSLFLSVLLCSLAWLAVYCENLQIHWFETMAVLLLSSKNLEFCASHSQFGTSREKNFVFLPRCAKLTVLSTKLKVFCFEKQNCHSCSSMKRVNSHSALLTLLVCKAKQTEKWKKPFRSEHLVFLFQQNIFFEIKLKERTICHKRFDINV